MRDVVDWYLSAYHGGPDDVGLVRSFTDRERMGHMAVDHDAIATGQADELFRLLIGVAMFQRLRDVLVLQIMRSLSDVDAAELTSSRALRALSDRAACTHARSNAALIGTCDLTKHPASRQGTCGVAPDLECYLKRHTELLRRYGHFGKVPTSIALAVAERGAADLNALRAVAIASSDDPGERARSLESMLSDAWRVNNKIACMFLSLVSAPDLGLSSPPWAPGLDWTWFVVIDSNVDLFLESIGYAGPKTYNARRAHIRELAAAVDLAELRPGLVPNNPRLVQQAMFMFMSRSNRRASATDCSNVSGACARCPSALRTRCPSVPERAASNGRS